MIFSRKSRQFIWGWILGAGTAFLAVNLLFNPGPNSHEPLFALDAWVYDRLVMHRPNSLSKPAGEIPEVFIAAFDEDSFSTLQTLPDPRLAQWPWPPNLFAQVIRRLKQLGVAVIGIDKLFIESHLLNDPKNPDGLESELAQACQDHGKVVLASKIETVRLDKMHKIETLKEPREILLKAAHRGVVSLPEDPDKTIRRAFTYEDHQGKIYPAFAVEMFRLYRNLGENDLQLGQPDSSYLGTVAIPLHHGAFYIAYPKQRIERFPFYLFVDELYENYKEIFFAVSDGNDANPGFDIRRLKNSIVLMGATTGDLHDMFQTPIQTASIPGVEVHAYILQTLLSGNILQHFDDRLQIWGTFILAVLLCGLGSFGSIRNGILGSSLGVLSWVSAAILSLWYWGFVLRIITPAVCLFLATATTISYRFIFEEREKRLLKRLFSKATDETLVEQLLENPGLVQLGGDRRQVTILFSDIRSFSTLSETMDPKLLINFLNDYFSVVTEVIFRHHGMIDKFIGDAVMAIFGAPIPSQDHAYQACKTAVEMLQAQKEFSNLLEKQGQSPFHIGIGIHTGFAVLGNLGSEKRSNYTCIGDTVNVASRVEGLNKQFATEILITEATAKACRELLEIREMGSSDIRGRSGKVFLYELLDVKNQQKD